jgi:sugar phosphate isomerase/epimerase
VAAIDMLQPRIYAVHLKDFVDDRTEVQPGTGRLDLPATLAALVRVGMPAPFVLEYEADEHDPTPAVRKATDAVRAAMPAGA